MIKPKLDKPVKVSPDRKTQVLAQTQKYKNQSATLNAPQIRGGCCGK